MLHLRLLLVCSILLAAATESVWALTILDEGHSLFFGFEGVARSDSVVSLDHNQILPVLETGKWVMMILGIGLITYSLQGWRISLKEDDLISYTPL